MRLYSQESHLARPRTRAGYIPTLDGWRGIAISLVLAAHTYAWLGFGTAKLARMLHYPWIETHIQRAGLTGVEVFFCISGFLITRRLLEARAPLHRFYFHRAFRILPAALVYLIAVSILGAIGLIAVSPREVIACVFFYRNYVGEKQPFTAHFWSLSIEEQYYLVWPSVLALAGVGRSRLIAAAGILGVVVWRQIHWPLPGLVYFHTDMRLDAILCGCLMALSWPGLERLAQNVPPLGMLAAAIALVATDPLRDQLQGGTDLIRAALICLLLAATIAVPERMVSRILEMRPLVFLGRMSYSIYLWQQVFLVTANDPRWQLAPRLAGILGLAWLSYKFIERPLIAWSHRPRIHAVVER